MDRPLLNDKNERPDDEVLARCLGKAKPAWDAFAADVSAAFGDQALEWRYYNDGKAWLCKVVHRKKTVCWASVWDRFFQVAFYFTAKNDADIAALPIPDELKEAYREHPGFGKMKPVVVQVKTRKVLPTVSVIAKYKSGLK